MPPLPVDYSEQARADIRMIVQESEVRFGARQAARYNDAIETACQRTGSYPDIGSAQADLPAIRALLSGSHRVYYVVESDRVLILRILHQRVRLSDAD